LSIDILIQLGSDINDKLSHLWRNLARMGLRSFGVISIPIGCTRPISTEPFEEPFLGSSYFMINRDRGFALQVLFNSHISQRFLFHRSTSMVDLVRDILPQFQPQGNRCIDTKTDIKGNPCSDTSGLPMY
jgi:hypothetical protein